MSVRSGIVHRFGKHIKQLQDEENLPSHVREGKFQSVIRKREQIICYENSEIGRGRREGGEREGGERGRGKEGEKKDREERE